MAALKEQIRQGNILFYSMKSHSELEDMGMETFIDRLGIPFLGACR